MFYANLGKKIIESVEFLMNVTYDRNAIKCKNTAYTYERKEKTVLFLNLFIETKMKSFKLVILVLFEHLIVHTMMRVKRKRSLNLKWAYTVLNINHEFCDAIMVNVQSWSFYIFSSNIIEMIYAAGYFKIRYEK